MSLQAISWALKVGDLRSTEKFVLVCMCNYADENGFCYPSIAALSDDTAQDRKTVIANIKSLVLSGLIGDTGKRVGATKQIIVYRVNNPKNGTNKESQNRNSSENGTVPILDGNSTVLVLEQSQKRDTDPKGSIRNRKNARNACRLPDDFKLTQERRLVAEAETLPADRTFAKFCDYWKALGGAKARKTDWDATWRNWCRNESDRALGKPAKPLGSPYRNAI